MEVIPSEVRKGSLAIIYSALFAFVSAIASIIATRKLNPNDFGDYQFLATYSSLFMLGISTLTWFLTRFTARGYDVKKEGFLLGSSLISITALIFMPPLFIPLSSIFKLDIYEIFSTIIFFISQAFFILVSSIIQGKDVSKPNEGNLLQAILRVSFLIVALYILAFSPSVFLFLSISAITNFLGFIYLLVWFRRIKGEKILGKLCESFKKLWYFPFFTNLATALIIYDSVYISIFITSTLPLAYFRAAYVIANIVSYTQAVAIAYYRSFMEKDNVERITQAIKAVSLFSFFSAFFIVSIGDLLLGILRPAYILSYPTLIVLSLTFILGNLSTLFSSTIMSMEKLDIDLYSKRYRESYFFDVLKTIVIQVIIQYSWLTVLGLLSKIYTIEPSLIAFYWSISWLVSNFAAIIIFYNKLKSFLSFKFPFKSILLYLIATVVPCVITILIKPKQIYQSIYSQILNTIPPAVLYLIMFLALLILLDKSMRERLKAVIRFTIKYFKFNI